MKKQLKQMSGQTVRPMHLEKTKELLSLPHDEPLPTIILQHYANV